MKHKLQFLANKSLYIGDNAQTWGHYFIVNRNWYEIAIYQTACSPLILSDL